MTQPTTNMPVNQWKQEPGRSALRLSERQINTEAASFANLKDKPTTLSGYGITNAVDVANAQSIEGVKTFPNGISFDGTPIKFRWSGGYLEAYSPNTNTWHRIALTS